jgi:radical SAM protein with 4Fe4S-binding SPASM domain
MVSFAKLKKDWMLRGWSDVPTVAVKWMTGEQRELNVGAFYVAEHCNGETDFGSLAFLPEHQALLQKLIDVGIAEECREGDLIEGWQQYRKAANPRFSGIHWCITGHCNLNCRHCYMEAPDARYGQLHFEDMARLIDQFEEANVLEVVISGGEPFVRKDILDIFELLARKNIRVSEIYSNGLPITDAHLARIKEMGFLPMFQISFDGVGCHDQMRGKAGVEQKVIDAITKLRNAGISVAVATSVDKVNIGRLPETYELLKRLDIQAWIVSAPVESGDWKGTGTAVSLDELAEGYEPLLNPWIEDDRPFDIHLAPMFRGREGTGQATAAPVVNLQSHSNFAPDSYDCGACREQPNLLPDGRLFPCPGYVDSLIQDRMPNLFQEDLSSVWNQSLLRQLSDMKKKDILAANPGCAVCDQFEECGIGCRAAALRLTGELMAKDPAHCELLQKGYKRRFQELADRAVARHRERSRTVFA